MSPGRFKRDQDAYTEASSASELEVSEYEDPETNPRKGIKKATRSSRVIASRTRAGRRKRSKQSPAEGVAESASNEASAPLTPRAENTSGLATLPTELLAEITAYLPSMKLPFKENLKEPLSRTEHGLARLNFLRALSQTCRSLRSFALPLCWETIEVVSCDSKLLINWQGQWPKHIATELVRQLEIVTIRDPSLAQYVKIVNVMITTYSTKGVVYELARCLSLFPNLETIQILGDVKSEIHFQTAFRGLTFPKVHTLFLMQKASTIVKSCPGVRRVNGCYWDSGELDAIPLVEEVRTQNIGYLILSDDLTDKCPMLKVVDLRQEIQDFGFDRIPEILGQLPKLKHLQCIRLHYLQSDNTWEYGGVMPHYNALAESIRVIEASPPPLPGCHKCVIEIHKESAMTCHHVVSGNGKESDCTYL